MITAKEYCPTCGGLLLVVVAPRDRELFFELKRARPEIQHICPGEYWDKTDPDRTSHNERERVSPER